MARQMHSYAYMSWKTSLKFRFQAKAMFKHLILQEKKWKAIAALRVHNFTPEELQAFAASRGCTVSSSSSSSSTSTTTADGGKI